MLSNVETSNNVFNKYTMTEANKTAFYEQLHLREDHRSQDKCLHLKVTLTEMVKLPNLGCKSPVEAWYFAEATIEAVLYSTRYCSAKSMCTHTHYSRRRSA